MFSGAQLDQFGYRVISYDGKIESIAYSDLKKYLASDSAEVSNVFSSQNNRLADNGLFPNFIAPAKAGGLIVGSRASEAEKILDVVFGVPALDRTPRVVARTEEKKSALGSFNFAACGQFNPLSLMINFRAAVTAAHNDNSIRPALIAA